MVVGVASWAAMAGLATPSSPSRIGLADRVCGRRRLAGGVAACRRLVEIRVDLADPGLPWGGKPGGQQVGAWSRDGTSRCWQRLSRRHCLPHPLAAAAASASCRSLTCTASSSPLPPPFCSHTVSCSSTALSARRRKGPDEAEASQPGPEARPTTVSLVARMGAPGMGGGWAGGVYGMQSGWQQGQVGNRDTPVRASRHASLPPPMPQPRRLARTLVALAGRAQEASAAGAKVVGPQAAGRAAVPFGDESGAAGVGVTRGESRWVGWDRITAHAREPYRC